MADTQELLNRIATFRRKLEATPTLVETKPVAVAPVVASEPPKLTARAQRLLVAARELIARQKQFITESLVNDADSLGSYHRATVGLTDSALRLAQQLPGDVHSQMTACDGLEHLLKVIEQRNGSLQEAIAIRATDLRRLDRLCELLMILRNGTPTNLNPFVDLANELLDESRKGSRLRLLDPLYLADGLSVKYIAANAINIASIVARLLPHDFEWAAKPVLPVLAALVMDVGLISVDSSILFANRELTVEERRLLELHPREGSDLIRKMLPDSGPLADLVLAHHERPDGTGYPLGMTGETIPTLARFLSAVDTYAALVSNRPHRDAMDTRSALTEVLMLAEQGKLDRDFAEYHLNLSFHPVGTVVELTDGRLAVVAATHARRADVRASSRPVVAILTDADGSVRPRPEFLDLAAADRGGILRSVQKRESRSKLSEWYPELCV